MIFVKDFLQIFNKYVHGVVNYFPNSQSPSEIITVRTRDII